jgi:hypothetical protein
MTEQTTESQAAVTAATPTPVPAAPNAFVTMVKKNFHFKKDKDTVQKDPETGVEKVIEEGKKLPTAECYLPIPKAERIVEFLQATGEQFAKERELVMAAIEDVIYGVARGQINEFREKNPKDTVTNAVLDYDKLDFTVIANTPRAERGAYAPSEDELKAFLESYQEVMPAASGKKPEVIKNHVALFQAGFKKQRNQKDVLQLFVDMLQIYITTAPADIVEEHQEVLEYFINKLKKWLTAEEKITMDML